MQQKNPLSSLSYYIKDTRTKKNLRMRLRALQSMQVIWCQPLVRNRKSIRGIYGTKSVLVLFYFKKTIEENPPSSIFFV